jgi:hypothetical protein
MRHLTLISLLLSVGAAWAQPAAVGSGCYAFSANGLQLTQSCALDVVVGNQLHVSVGNYFYAGTAISDDSVAVCGAGSANTYAPKAGISSSNWALNVYYVASIVCSGHITVTATFTNQSGNPGPAITVQQYSGISSTQDGATVSGTATTVGDVSTCGAITTTNANDVIVTVGSGMNGGSTRTGSIASPFAGRVGNGAVYPGQAMTADDIISSTGTYTPVFTFSDGPSAVGCVTFAMQSAAAANKARRRVITGDE